MSPCTLCLLLWRGSSDNSCGVLKRCSSTYRYPHFLRICVMLLCFHWRPMWVLFFWQQKEIWRRFSLLGKKVKSTKSVQHWFWSAPWQGQPAPQGRAPQAPSPNHTQPLSPKSPEPWTLGAFELYLHLFWASLSKTCPEESEKPKRGDFGGLGTLNDCSM